MRVTILIYFLFTFYSFSQNESLGANWGEFIESKRRSKSPELIGTSREAIFLIRYEKQKRFLERYNLSTLKIEKSVRLNLEYNNNDFVLSDYFMLGENPILYTSYFDKKTRNRYYYLQRVQPNTLLVEKPIEVSKRFIEKVKAGNLMLAGSSGQNAAARTRLSSFILSKQISENNDLISLFSPKDDDNSLSFEGSLYDEDFSKVRDMNLKLPYENFMVNQTKLTSEGLIYILGFKRKITEEKKLIGTRTREKRGTTYLMIYDTDAEELEALEIIPEGGGKISMCTFSFTDAGFQVAGLIAKEEGGVAGTFAITFNEDFVETNNVFHPFEEDFVRQTMSEKEQEKLDKKNEKKEKRGKEKIEPEFYDYYVDHLLVNKDGTTTMIAEQYYVRVVTSTYMDAQGRWRTRTDYYYYYNDIIVVNFDEDGNYSWKTIVEKKQVSVNDYGYYSSYFPVSSEDGVSIIYNGYEEEETQKKKGGLFKSRPQVGKNTFVDDEGNQTTKVIFSFEDDNIVRLVPKRCSQVDGNMAFLYARGRKGDRIGTLTID